MNWLLKHLWPFSEIRRLHIRLAKLEASRDASYEFGELCCKYLDQVDAPRHHVQLNGKLYVIGVDSTSVVEPINQPRTMWKMEGFDA